MDTAAFSLFFALLTVVAQVVVVSGVFLATGARASRHIAAWRDRARAYLEPAALPFAWAVALTATAGSLYYSEVAGYVPCKLCWYQRIGMYPLVLVLGIAWWRRDVLVRRYVIPLAVAGGAISIYHYQLQRFPGQGSFSCTAEAPCTLTWVWQFHYISIPMMALSAFALITMLLSIARAPSAPSSPATRARETVEASR